MHINVVEPQNKVCDREKSFQTSSASLTADLQHFPVRVSWLIPKLVFVA